MKTLFLSAFRTKPSFQPQFPWPLTSYISSINILIYMHILETYLLERAIIEVTAFLLQLFTHYSVNDWGMLVAIFYQDEWRGENGFMHQQNLDLGWGWDWYAKLHSRTKNYYFEFLLDEVLSAIINSWLIIII